MKIRWRIQDIVKGDRFVVNGYICIAGSDAHQNLDEKDEPWIVYDTDGYSWFEEDLEAANPTKPTGNLLKQKVVDALESYIAELGAARSTAKSDDGQRHLTARIGGVKNICRELQSLSITDRFDPDRQIALVWSIEDVQSVRPDLDETQAMDVLDSIEANHDCTIGVTWDTVEAEASNLYPEKK